MRIQFGAIVVAGAGKAGGTIIQRGRTGQVLRNLTKPVTRNQLKSVYPRMRLTSVSSSWRFLAPVDVISWNNLATTLTRYNKFGVAYTPTGYQIFCEFNMRLQIIDGNTVLEPAPAITTYPITTDWVLVANATGPSIELQWLFQGGESKFQFFISFYPLQSLGASVPRGSSLYAGVSGSIDDEAVDLTDAFESRFGAPRGGNWKIAIEVKIFQNSSGFNLPSLILMVPFSTP